MRCQRVSKNALQGLAFERLLQHRHGGETAVDAFGFIAGDEHERHPLLQPARQRGINQFTAQIYVQDRRLERRSSSRGHRVDSFAKRTNDLKSKVHHQIVHGHRHQGFVLDDHHAICDNHRIGIGRPSLLVQFCGPAAT